VRLVRHPLSPQLRGLADDLDVRHPDLGAGDHVRDAADALDAGLHDGAKRHLRAAMANLTPASLTRHGLTQDGDHQAAKRSMDDIHRHLLLVQQDADEGDGGQATDRQPDVTARTDVTQPIPQGSQRMGTYSNDADDDDGSDSNGLTPRGQGIYKKLIAKGVAVKVALAMARRAQNTTPGKQFANDGGGGYELAGPDPYAALELAHQQAARRQAEDAADAARLARRWNGSGGIHRGQAERGARADRARHLHPEHGAAGAGVRQRRGQLGGDRAGAGR
jgi:hypothetical protein